MLLVQLTLSALFRHESYGVDLHITMAVFVVLLAVACGARAWGLYSGLPRLPQIGRMLLALIALQVALGIGALVSADFDAGAESPPAADVILTTAHQTVGVVLLAWAVVLTLCNHRLLLPDVGGNKARSTLPAGNTA